MSTQPRESANGDCFVAAGKFISADVILDYPQDYRLVHGNLRHLRQDVTFNHAWVEEADFVLEISNGQNIVLPREAYYQAQGVTTVRKYTPEEALVLMIRHGHWGPWE